MQILRINKKRRNSKLTIDRILLKSDTNSKFRRENAQCLTVTLKILNKRNERRTDTPNDSSGLKCVQITSNIDPTITLTINLNNIKTILKHTIKSNILNDDAKY